MKRLCQKLTYLGLLTAILCGCNVLGLNTQVKCSILLPDGRLVPMEYSYPPWQEKEWTLKYTPNGPLEVCFKGKSDSLTESLKVTNDMLATAITALAGNPAVRAAAGK